MKKIFTNDGFFLTTVILAVFGQLFSAVESLFIYHSTQSGVTFLAIAICEIVLYISYKKHEKNVMKGIMGALLMAMFLSAVSWIGSKDIVNLICGTVEIIIVVSLFANHFVVNTDHRSKSENVLLNQAFTLIYFVNLLVLNVADCMMSISAMYVAESIIGIVSAFGIAASIVCVESRLDAYRIDRENAGWTEEKGYPENYVHECDKDN